MKKLYIFDGETRQYVCEYMAEASPCEPGKCVEPTHSTDIEPPAEIEGKTLHFENGAWIYRDVPAEPEPEPPTRRELVLMELAQIDFDSVRPARAVALAMASGVEPDAADIDMLALLEARAIDLRAELAALA